MAATLHNSSVPITGRAHANTPSPQNFTTPAAAPTDTPPGTCSCVHAPAPVSPTLSFSKQMLLPYLPAAPAAVIHTGLDPVDVLLLMAASENDLPKIEELLAAGADVSVTDSENRTPLELATKEEALAALRAAKK